ncbi:DUF6789 family protein [Halomicrobium urmianum]|uniref:DUF6789 family protein n=1 Tax=Halomicrobium urmianum TaxID=1586233 RepID=UPI001CDA40E3|nr:DUF6789 family protein [Halomicrobium urmianum]
MEPVRSALGGGVAATIALTVFLLALDVFLQGTNLFVFATFTSLCAVGGPPYCEAGSTTAAAITFFWFLALYVIAWPLLFAGFTWGLPGESGFAHGVVYGLILWSGYGITVIYEMGLGGETLAENLPMLVITVVAYLIYGLVLGGGYDHLAGHRTFLSQETT